MTVWHERSRAMEERLPAHESQTGEMGFGHDFSDRELWIIDFATGRKIALIASELNPVEAERIGRLVRQAPVLTDACEQRPSLLPDRTGIDSR